MQSVLYEICMAEIREDAQELTRVNGKVATSQDGGDDREPAGHVTGYPLQLLR